MAQSKASGTEIHDEPLDDATVRRLFRETAKDIPPADSILFERIEESIEQTRLPASSYCSSFTTFARSLLERFRVLFSRPQLAWGIAGMQAIALCFFLIHVPGQQSYQTLSADPVSQHDETAPVFYVIFRDDAQIGEVKHFLEKNKAMIVNGPGKRGIYTIQFTRKDLLTAKEQTAILASSPLIIFAEQVY